MKRSTPNRQFPRLRAHVWASTLRRGLARARCSEVRAQRAAAGNSQSPWLVFAGSVLAQANRATIVGRTSNRDGLGTVVRVTLEDGRVLVNHATTSSGFASSSDSRVHFGLGPEARVKQIDLVWPSGVRQTIQAPQVNATVTIEEPATRQQ